MKLKLKAILFGLLLSICLDALSAIVVISYFKQDQTNYHPNSPELAIQVALLIGGFLSGLLGGYLTGWLAKPASIINAVTLGLIGVVISFPLLFISSVDRGMPWYNIMSIVLFIPSTYLGGGLANFYDRKKL